jgi:hypothetical protein
MSQTPPTGRAKSSFTILLILLPLLITAFIKYRTLLDGHREIKSLAVVQPLFLGPAESRDLATDAGKQVRDALSELPGIEVHELPRPEDSRPGGDIIEAAKSVGAQAVVIPTLTIDSGITQLNLQIIDVRSRRIIFNKPFQSSIQNYPDMVKAANAALKRAL